MTSSIIDKISEKIKQQGFNHFGFARLEKPMSIHLYREWLEAGHHGKMDYLQRHLPFKEDPQQLAPRARSAIVIGLNYLPHPEPGSSPVKALKVARYARGQDYHRFFQSRLEDLARELATIFAQEQFVAFSDSAPVLERDLAYRAGLGWIGKNSCLIHPARGSLFLLGEIYTSLDLDLQPRLVHDFCGQCRRCIDACPTQAIQENRTLKAQDCISYLNIELKEPPPRPLRSQMQGWFFGCDICQEVCPWNQKVFGPALEEPTPSRSDLIEDLRWILGQSNKSLEKAFAGTPLLRRGGLGLKKNALLIAAEFKVAELEEDIENCGNQYPALFELSRWTLEQLKHSLPQPPEEPAKSRQ